LLRMLLTGLSRFSTGNLRLSMMMSVSMMIERDGTILHSHVSECHLQESLV
jgi:hypothetical protein